MALSPLNPSEDRAVIVQSTVAPSKTYAFDFDTGELGGVIDGKEAVKQAIQKTIATALFRYAIYDDYGCELENLIGQDLPIEVLETEISRMITEALIVDDRIIDATDFTIERSGDTLSVSFSVTTMEGAIDMEVTL